MNRNERGFSMVKVLFWLIIFSVSAWQGLQVLQIYQTSWKVQDVFDGIARNMSTASEADIHKRLPALLKIQFVSRDDLPDEFYRNLKMDADGNRVVIATNYRITLWPLGPVEAVDEDGTYDPEQLSGKDYLRDKLRMDFEFEPYAKTP